MVVPSTQPYQGCVGNDRLPARVTSATLFFNDSHFGGAIKEKGSESFFLEWFPHSRFGSFSCEPTRR